MDATKYLTLANQFLSRSAKVGALLQYVHQTGEAPHGITESARITWQAMLTVGLVEVDEIDGASLTVAGEAVRQLADRGEF